MTCWPRAVVEGVGRENGFFLVVTLQLSMQFFAPMRGDWLCQDTRALHVADGFATGSVNLWSEDATLGGLGVADGHADADHRRLSR